MMIGSGSFSWQGGIGDLHPPAVLHWDGRIDNSRDLARQLVEVPEDADDSTFVARAYARWGMAGLGRLVGDWSVVLYDPTDQAIVLASDYAGIRPLYYHHRQGSIRWSTRLGPLVKASGAETLDEFYTAAFLTCGGCPDRTPYDGVHSVPAGQAVRATATQVTVHPFWFLPTGNVIRYADERRYDEEFRELLWQAVAARLRGNEAAVAELSGGLDSSSVVCVAQALMRSGAVPPRRLITISFLHRGSADAPFVQAVESHCGVEGIHLSMHDTPLTSLADGRQAVPGDAGPIEAAAAAAARRTGTRTYLTGQFGDVVTGNWFDDSLQVAAALRRGRFGQAGGEALAWSKHLRIPALWIMWRAFRALMPPAGAPSTLYAADGQVPPEGTDTSVRSDFLARVGFPGSRALFPADWMEARPERRRHFRVLSMMRALRSLRVPESMEGLGYTHPFAHRPLVEFLMSIPADVLCRPGDPRRLMRRALADVWPAKLRTRRSKSLFDVPHFDALKPLAASLLSDPQWQVVDRGWVDRASFGSRLQKLKNGIDCDVPQLRLIIQLEYWLRERTSSRAGLVTRKAG